MNSNSTKATKQLTLFTKPILKTKPLDQITCVECYSDIITRNDKWVSKCNKCNTIFDFFNPTSLQQAIINEPSNVIVIMAGYGSGKTTLSSYYWSWHLRTFPNALVIGCAQTEDQMKKLIIKELEAFFLDEEFLVKNKEEWVLRNNSKIVFASDKNDEAIRSGNATGIWMVEASGINHNWFDEGIARLRNNKATYFNQDFTKMIIETNPTYGWVKDLALSAHKIVITPRVKNQKILLEQATFTNQSIASYIATTEDNPNLPANYLERSRSNYSPSKFDMMFYADLTRANDLVYENILLHKDKYQKDLSPFLPSHEWKFVESLDPGGAKKDNNKTAYVLGRFNPNTYQLEILAAWAQAGTLVSEDTKRIIQTREYFGYNRNNSLFFTGDNALKKASKTDRITLKQEYEKRLNAYIDTQGVKVGGIEQGTQLVNEWFKQNKVVINSQHTQDLWNNFLTYRYVRTEKFEKKLEETVCVTQFAGEDDVCDALKYLIVKLNQIYPIDQHEIDLNRNWMNNRISIADPRVQQDALTQTIRKEMFKPFETKNNNNNNEGPLLKKFY